MGNLLESRRTTRAEPERLSSTNGSLQLRTQLSARSPWRPPVGPARSGFAEAASGLLRPSLHRAPRGSDPWAPVLRSFALVTRVDRLAEDKPLATCQRASVSATDPDDRSPAVSCNARPTPATRESGATKNSVNRLARSKLHGPRSPTARAPPIVPRWLRRGSLDRRRSDQGDRSLRRLCDDQRRWDVTAHQREHLDQGGQLRGP